MDVDQTTTTLIGDSYYRSYSILPLYKMTNKISFFRVCEIVEELDHYNYKDKLLDEIYQELRVASLKDDLSDQLKCKLEKLSRSERKELVSRTKDGSAVLFVACKKGNLAVVRYLIETCDADPEQIGKSALYAHSVCHRAS